MSVPFSSSSSKAASVTMAAVNMRSRTRKGMIALLWLLAGTIAAVHAAMQYISIGSSRGSSMHAVGPRVAYRSVSRQAMRGGSISKRRSNINEVNEDEVAKPSANEIVDGAGGIMLGGISALGAAAILSNPVIAAVSVVAAGAAAFAMKRSDPESEETQFSNRSSGSEQQRSQSDEQTAAEGAGDAFTGILRGGVAVIAIAGLYALSTTQPMYALGALVASAAVAAIMSFSSSKAVEEDEEIVDNVVEEPSRPMFGFFAGKEKDEPMYLDEQEEQGESKPAFGFFHRKESEPDRKQQPQIEAPQPAFSFFGKKEEPQQSIEQDTEDQPGNLYDFFNYLGSPEPYEKAEPALV